MGIISENNEDVFTDTPKHRIMENLTGSPKTMIKSTSAGEVLDRNSGNKQVLTMIKSKSDGVLERNSGHKQDMAGM